jgi:transposase InsO family protein
MLAYLTGTVDQELLLRSEYLLAENRILHQQLKGRLRLTDPERRTLAEIAQRLGRKALREVATLVTPETLLGWYRKLIARKFDGSKQRRTAGRPRTSEETEALILKLARENRSWGYKRLAGALAALGIKISVQTVGSILLRHELPPAPLRKKGMPWKDFIRSHLDVLAATDFFSAEVLTLGGLVSYYVLFFIHLGTRKVHLAGITSSPDEAWMKQIARNLTDAEDGFLRGRRFLIHDRDGKYCPAFREVLHSSGVTCLPLPPRSPNLNAFSERWVLSVKEECLGKLILFGKSSLRKAVTEYLAHHQHERPHQGLGNAIPFQNPEDCIGNREGLIRCRERLGGLLKFYHRITG